MLWDLHLMLMESVKSHLQGNVRDQSCCCYLGVMSCTLVKTISHIILNTKGKVFNLAFFKAISFLCH